MNRNVFSGSHIPFAHFPFFPFLVVTHLAQKTPFFGV